MNYFFDNNLSPHLAKAVAALCAPEGHRVIHKLEKFSPNTPDIDWVRTLVEEGNWVIISHDRFSKTPLEKEALRSSGLISFILKKGWKDKKAWDQAWRIIRWWPHIMNQSELVSSGVFEVPFKGTKLQPMKL